MHKNLIEALRNCKSSERGIRFIHSEFTEEFLSYGDLYDEASKMLYYLQKEGIKEGDEILFYVEENRDFVCLFWTCILGKLIPVPISAGNNAESKIRLMKIWKILQKPWLVIDRQNSENILDYVREKEHKTEQGIKCKIIYLDNMKYETEPGEISEPDPDDLAVIQFSSGSSGDPKGVRLTHKNILCDNEGIIERLQLNDQDSFLNWMPLSHNMGLIGLHLIPVIKDIDQYLIPTSLIIQNPVMWMDKASEWKATLLASPNFGYKIFLKSMVPDKKYHWDLSHIRFICNGAEPISSQVNDTFLDKLKKYGLDKRVMTNAYGMAEAGLLITCHGYKEGFRTVWLDRKSVRLGERVVSCDSTSADAVDFVTVGYPLKGQTVRICSMDSVVLPEGYVGEIQAKGPNITCGYYNNREGSRNLFTTDGWLKTGDVGFFIQDRLVVTGRVKDIIFVNGKNYYPYDIERIIISELGSSIKDLAVCGIYDRKQKRDTVAVFILYHDGLQKFLELTLKVRQCVSKNIGVSADIVVPVCEIPKTVSGKVARFKLIEGYQDGEYDSVIQTMNEMDVKEETDDSLDQIDAIEKILSEIYKKALQDKTIYPYQNIMELGADSFTLIKIRMELERLFPGKIKMSDLFVYTTLADMAEYIRNMGPSLGDIPDQPEVIARMEEAEYYPASMEQKRIFVTHILNRGDISYNLPIIFSVTGKIDLGRLEKILTQLLSRHEILRTSFKMIDGSLFQKICEQTEVKVEVNKCEEKDIHTAIQQFIRPFDLTEKPPIRGKMLRIAEETNIFMLDVHHILIDGTTAMILWKEFLDLFRGRKLHPIEIRYIDYAVWQLHHYKSVSYKMQEKYWLSIFAEEPPVLNMMTDYIRPVIRRNNGSTLSFCLSKNVTEKLGKLAAEKNATLYMALLTLYNILLYHYTGQRDIVVGSPVAGRVNAQTAQVAGIFINMLPMRNRPEPDKYVMDFLEEVRDTSVGAYENQEYRFEELVENLNLVRDTGRNPIFDTMLVLQNEGREIGLSNLGTPEIDILLSDMHIKTVPYPHKTSKYDITLEALESREGLVFHLEYCTDLFKQETMERFARHFKNLAEDVAEHPHVKITDTACMGPDETDQILHMFNDTEFAYNRDITIVDLFEKQTELHPNDPAVFFNEESLTYGEFNKRANQLAIKIRLNGIKPGGIVALLMERSLDMMVSLMAVWKAGGAYLPIDPSYPDQRIRFILENSNTQQLLCLSGREVEGYNGNIIRVDDNSIYTCEVTDPDRIHTVKDLAYIIYTSGSTGTPKGVMIEHGSVVNRLNWMQRSYPIGCGDVIMQKTAYTFDVSVWELFWWGITGGSVLLLEPHGEKDPRMIADAIERGHVTVMHFVPSMLSIFLVYLEEWGSRHDLSSLKRVFVSGEAVTRQQVNLFYKLVGNPYNVTLVNLYGPTEATVDVTSFECHSDDSDAGIPIGRPIDNTHIYIVGENHMLQPVGVPGELCIAGDGLARGYLNNQSLTDEKFVKNPFAEKYPRMYRTGDLARWLSDGNIEFISRIDHQIKIRGFRIELGEIEHQILAYQDKQTEPVCNRPVRQVAAIDRKDAEGDRYICAYYVSEHPLKEEQLRAHCALALPDYMIPSFFVPISEIPVSANGKLDRKRLPEPDIQKINHRTHKEAETELEKALVLIWKKILNKKEISISDNFFEIGGHSLKAVGLVSEIHKELQTEIGIIELFHYPTVEQLAMFIQSRDKSSYEPIESVREQRFYPASSAQKRIYTLQQLDPDSVSYNIYGAVNIEGDLDKNRLSRAFDHLMKRHETLRTSFYLEQGDIVQKIEDYKDFIYDDCECDSASLDLEIKTHIRVFDLSEAPMIQAALIRVTDDNRYVLFLNVHHIAADGASLEILFHELARLYDGEILSPLRLQYRDFTIWQNKLFQGEAIKRQEDYWIRQLTWNKDKIAVFDNSELPADYERPAVLTFEGADIHFETGSKLTEKIRSLARQTGTTTFMVLLAAYNILLSRYTGSEDIVVGSPVAGRSHADLEGMVGMFVNTLAIRNFPKKNKTVAAFLEKLKETCLHAYENQDYPFEELVEKLVTMGYISRDLSRNPVFDTMFAMQNFSQMDIRLGDCKITPYEIELSASKFDITLTAYEGEDDIYFVLQYYTRLFEEGTVQRFASHFLNIINDMTTNVERSIESIRLFSEQERRILTEGMAGPVINDQREKSVHEMFEEQAGKTPENTAILYEDKRITYRELNEKANQVAWFLKKEGVKPDTLVGVMVEKTPEMLIGILGVLKAGGAYLPVDPGYPGKRIAYMLEDSRVQIILMNQEHDIEQIDGKRIFLVSDILKNQNMSIKNVNETYVFDRTMYVIHTSGSTGKPKGAAVKACSFTNLINWYIRELSITESDTVMLVAPVSFDLAQKNLFASLIVGGRLCIVEDHYFDSDHILDVMEKDQCTIINCTPSAFYLLVHNENTHYKLASLKYVVLGGEPIQTGILKHWITSPYYNAQIINSYGPTECTDVVAFFRLPNNRLLKLDHIPIGRPIDNVRLYILDQDRQPVIKGHPGELYIGGACVGKGYLNGSSQNQEKFIDNPFIEEDILYRTGDLVKWLNNDTIEFIGRIDQQVKIRGYRVELGEITDKLISHADVRDAVVLDLCSDAGDKYLCAYIVWEKGADIDTWEDISGRQEAAMLSRHLKENLPEYMIPVSYVVLDRIPLNPNGKVDRKALPVPKITGKASAAQFEEPFGDTEKRLALIWESLLHVEHIGRNDGFFDLGGQSLKAALLASEIHKVFSKKLPLKTIFQSPVLRDMAERIDGTSKERYQNIMRTEKKEYYCLSSAQKRMYILNQFEDAGTSYNMPGVLLIEGLLDKERVERTFQHLIDRHESLRTGFVTIDGQPVQHIYESLKFRLQYKKIEEFQVKEESRKFIQTFDLAEPPLIRAALLEIGPERFYMLFDMHHIISDGVSMEIIIREFTHLYSGRKLGDLRLQYKDYAVWQSQMLLSAEMKRQEEYWLKVFEDEIPILNMPCDYIRPAVQSFEGNTVKFQVGKELTGRLNHLAGETGATLYIVLLAAYNTLLYRYTDQEDIVVGTPVAGRYHGDLLNIIGMFVNTLAFRNHPKGTLSFREFLIQVKNNTLEGFENQDYQFEELVERLDLQRDMSRNPVFDTMFILQNAEASEFDISGLRFTSIPAENKISNFDLTMIASEISGELHFDLEYCTKLFQEDTMKRFADHFVCILENLADDANICLDRLNMLTEDEKETVIHLFNAKTADYPSHKTFHKLFQEQVLKTPDHVAVVYQDKSYTYHQLDRKSGQLACALYQKGVRRGSMAGIMVERSTEVLIGILAILKCGAAYVPLDPAQPEDRLNYMLRDSRSQLLLTTKELAGSLSYDIEILCLDEEQIYRTQAEPVMEDMTTEEPVYMIYTSGTTGNPKGVVVNHKNLVNIAYGWKTEYRLMEFPVRLLQMASFSFDVFAGDMARTLLNGGKMVICPADIRVDYDGLYTLLTHQKINIWESTPSLIIPFMDYVYEHKLSLSDMKLLIIGSDVLPLPDYKKVQLRFGSQMRIINSYGVTEAAIDSSYYEETVENLAETGVTPIGKPFQNVRFYIVNRSLMPQPVGVYGELCIGGDGVAVGYYRNQKLTEEKFIILTLNGKERVYRTGDMARWDKDGNIEFIGRIDHQVKIRGYRVELGEIEAQLLLNPDLREAVVLVHEDKTRNKVLCAYFTADKKICISDIRTYMEERLPSYMNPSYYVQLDAMPLTHNKKIDRKALTLSDEQIVTGMKYAAPSNKTELKLLELWKDILGIKKIGVQDNFFSCGGHSLSATVLASRIYKEFHVKIPLREIFKNPILKDMAVCIRNSGEHAFEHIVKAEKRKTYPLSSAQMRMYILSQMEQESTSYNMPGKMVVRGELKKDRLEEAIHKVIERHEVFRTSFHDENGVPVQKVHESVRLNVEYFSQKEWGALEKKPEFVRSFDLTKAPLIRIRCVQTDSQVHYIMFDMHHIISDGITVSLLMREFGKLYSREELPPVPLHYKDFAIWQNRLLKTDYIKRQEEYWLSQFQEGVPVLNLHYDYRRPAIFSREGNRIRFRANAALREGLGKLADNMGATLYMVLLAAYHILLYRYTDQNDIVIGLPIAGRHHAQTLDMMGMFVNTLAMINHVEGEESFTDFLSKVKHNALDAYDNQDYPFEDLVELLTEKGIMQRNVGRNPLFDTVLVMQNTQDDHLKMEGLSISLVEMENKTAKFDLLLNAQEEEGGITFELEYGTKLFRYETIERMGLHYLSILEEIVKNPGKKTDEIELIGEKERMEILQFSSGQMAWYPSAKTIHEIFEETADQFTTHTAVVYEGRSFSYEEINKRSNQIARMILEETVMEGTIVALILERSMDMIVSILGVLKAGCAYLPIDPEYPAARADFMLLDSGASLIICKRELKVNISCKCKVLKLNEKEICNREEKNLPHRGKPDDLAYIIYTSGTTGNPKGVMVEHRNVVSLICNNRMQFEYSGVHGFNEADVWTMFHSYCFDFSVWEMYGALLHGGKLVIVPRETARDTDHYLELLKKEKVTILNQIPAAFGQLAEREMQCRESQLGLRFVIFGGEALKPAMLKDWKKKYPKTKLINMYGITETTVHVTYKEITENEINSNISNIGKAISTQKVFILDHKQNLVPAGVPGELCVGGEGVARGYLNRPGLTAEKFIDSPFDTGERLYRSGDLARYLPGGEIEYLGRIDHQVKVRGHRIETGELEFQLLNHPNIGNAVVLAKKDPSGNCDLCAYYVTERPVSADALRDYLKKTIPEYMIPTYFIEMDCIPLTSIGKTDRKKLPEPQEMLKVNVSDRKPENEIQEKLVQMWEELLSVTGIGINDDFFALGGQSLRATTLASRIYKEFNVKVPLVEIFKNSTIEQLSGYIEQSDTSGYFRISQAGSRDGYGEDRYPLSSAQHRIYILSQLDKTGISYNMPAALYIQGDFNSRILEEVFQSLIKRHEVLRTSFENHEGKTVQKIHSSVPFQLEQLECHKNQEEEMIRKCVRPFLLEQAPLFRAVLISVEGEHILFMDMHHIISDGASFEILMKEFSILYGQMSAGTSVFTGESLLKALRIQYKDYAVWQFRRRSDPGAESAVNEQKAYWMKKLQGERPQLILPYDFERPVVQSFEGDSIKVRLNQSFKESLNQFCIQNETTLYMTLLAAYNVLLYKYSGQEDIIIGTPAAGRDHEDLHQVMGIFVNTLAMRNAPKGEKGFREFLSEVKAGALEAFDHQDYQFEELLDDLKLQRDLGRNPVFDTMLVLQNTDGYYDSGQIGGIVLKELPVKSHTSKFDITLNITERKEDIILEIEYCTKLFKRSSMERFLGCFRKILETVIHAPDIRLDEIEIISDKEKQRILSEWNREPEPAGRVQSIASLFEEQAGQTPNEAALYFHSHMLTYKETEDLSNRLSGILLEYGAGSGTVIAVMMERSMELVISILAVLKTGSAYLPVDPKDPRLRIRTMLKEGRASAVLKTADLLQNTDRWDIPVLDVELTELKKRKEFNSGCPVRKDEANGLAYIIFTSGTTGTPKGVMIENKNIYNTLYWRKEEYGLGAEHRTLQLFSPCFDGFVTSVFTPLISGASVVILDEYEARNPIDIARAVETYQITHMICVPTLYRAAAEYLDGIKAGSLKVITLAGEKVVKKDIELISRYNPNMELVNEYGPTECSVAATVLRDLQSKKISIGRPIRNAQVFILDRGGNLQPVGVEGELCITGCGVARGYINADDSKADKFISNPFQNFYQNNEDIGRMYRTGDKAKWNEDGYIEFIGRMDVQVKIRGHRIEPEEVERTLAEYGEIRQAAVCAAESEAGEYLLCGFYTSDMEVNQEELYEYMESKLPSYMVPSRYMRLSEIPVTGRGKVDREFMKKIEWTKEVMEEKELPATETEKALASIWADILDVSNIGRKTSFFALGGHSLKAAAMLSAIHKELHAKVPLSIVFQEPTISALAKYIDEADRKDYECITPVAEMDHYPLSSAQKRLYILQQMDKDSTSYNIFGAVKLLGSVDKEKLKKAVECLVERHDSFRTSFDMVEGEIVQRIRKEQPGVFMEIAQNNNEKELIRAFIRPFNLKWGPLLRVGIVAQEEEVSLLMFDMHHIIADGVSIKIFLKELTQLYNGHELEKPALQYRDYAVWQRRSLENEEMKNHKNYWLQILQGMAYTALPQNSAVSAKGTQGSYVDLILNEECTRKLSEYCIEHNNTKFNVLLSASQAAVYCETNQKDISVGTPLAGRSHQEIEHIIGVFLNVMIIRTKIQEEMEFSKLLKDVSDYMAEASEHQDYPYEELDYEMRKVNHYGEEALFSILVNFVPDAGENDLKLKGLAIQTYDFDQYEAKYDVTLYIREEGQRIRLRLVYRQELYGQSIMNRYLRTIEWILARALKEDPVSIGQIRRDLIMQELSPGTSDEFEDEFEEFWEVE